MKQKQLLRTLLAAVCLLAGQSVWAVDVASYDFNGQTTPFAISDKNRLSATYFEHVADGGDYYAKYTCINSSGGKPFAYYNFSSSVADAATVTVEFDFLSHQATGHALISLADANYHTSTGGGFTDKSATGYGANGAIFNLGTIREGSGNSASQKFGINTAQCDPEVAALDVWCHASITVDNVNRTVSYTIKNADQTTTLKSGTDVAFLDSKAQRCSQIDIYLGSNTNNYMYIDNLVITKTVSATSHTYSINAVTGGATLKNLVTSTATEGALYDAYIPYVVSKDSKYYRLDDAENTNINGYYASYMMLAADATKEINYSLIEDVVFYGEAEDICTGQSNGKTSSNVSVLSNGGGKYAMATSGYVTLTFNVPSAGFYDIKVGMNNTNGSNRGFSYQIDGGTASGTITVDANKAHVQEINDQYLTAGDHTIKLNITYSLTPVFDYVLVTSDYEFTEVIGATDFSSGDRAVKGSDITLNNGDVYHVTFNNYGIANGENKQNFVVLINNTASMYADWWDYAQGKGGWGTNNGFENAGLNPDKPYQVSTDGGTNIGNTGWTTEGQIKNSFVDLTIKYLNGRVTVEGTATSNTDANNIFYYGYAYTVADATNPAIVNLSVYNAWLGVLSVEQTAVGAPISEYGYATFSSTNAVNVDVEGLEAYVVTGKSESGSSIKTEKITGDVAANTGLILKGNAGTYSLPVVASGTAYDKTSNPKNYLFACDGSYLTVNAADEGTNYVLSVQEEKVVFAPIGKTSAPIKKGQAALWLQGESGPAKALALSFGDDVTGIEAVSTVEPQGAKTYYNLQGQRVSEPKQGIYVVDGKKVLVK